VETLKVPQWVQQANDDAKEGEIPVVVFRRSNLNGDVLGRWHVIEAADSWLRRIRDIELVRLD
jgi:sarcosine oxidase delta subunit